MIPVAFDYQRATSVEDAVDKLTEAGDEARVLSGGQSLIPFMRLRFAVPDTLVDISGIRDLSFVRVDADRIRIGAMTRHSDLARDPVIAANLPLLGAMAGKIGDTQVRNRGTLGGSVAHADPAAEYATLCTMLDAEIVTTRRAIPASEFFLGRYTTPLAHDEVLSEVTFPVATGGHSYIKFGSRLFDWAIVGVAAQVLDDGGRIGLVSMADVPIRAVEGERALAQGATAEEAGRASTTGLAPTASVRASAPYKLHLAEVLTARALREAGAVRV